MGSQGTRGLSRSDPGPGPISSAPRSAPARCRSRQARRRAVPHHDPSVVAQSIRRAALLSALRGRLQPLERGLPALLDVARGDRHPPPKRADHRLRPPDVSRRGSRFPSRRAGRCQLQDLAPRTVGLGVIPPVFAARQLKSLARTPGSSRSGASPSQRRGGGGSMLEAAHVGIPIAGDVGVSSAAG